MTKYLTLPSIEEAIGFAVADFFGDWTERDSYIAAHQFIQNLASECDLLRIDFEKICFTYWGDTYLAIMSDVCEAANREERGEYE